MENSKMQHTIRTNHLRDLFCAFTASELLKSGKKKTSLPKKSNLSACDEALRFDFLPLIPGTTEIGGARRDRTADPLLAKQVLSQLSYSPDVWWVWVDLNHRPHPYQGCALTN